MYEEIKLTKTRECIQCAKFFECKGKPPKVDRCVNFVERMNGNGGQKNVY